MNFHDVVNSHNRFCLMLYDAEWWNAVETQIREWYPAFYHNLYTQNPELSPHDIKLCSLLLLKHSRGDIASAFGITVESLNTACHRLRKKLKIPKSAALFAVILAIAELVSGGGVI